MVDVLHHVPAEGFHVCEVRDAGADPHEVVERQIDVGLMGDREKMQHRVGGSAERHHHRDRVLERFFGEDVGGGDSAPKHFDDGLPAATREPVATTIGGRW